MSWSMIVIMTWLSGCSFVFVSGPPPHYESIPAFHCTENQAAPYVDVLVGLLHGLAAITAATESDQRWSETYDGHPPSSRTTAAAVWGGTALMLAGSAYYGFKRTRECRDAKMQVMLRGVNPGPAGSPGWPTPGVAPVGTSWGRPLRPLSSPATAAPTAPAPARPEPPVMPAAPVTAVTPDGDSPTHAGPPASDARPPAPQMDPPHAP